jgi:hypothetical protein
VAVVGVASPGGQVLDIRPPKNMDLTLIASLPITELIVPTETAKAIHKKVRGAGRRLCVRGLQASIP